MEVENVIPLTAEPPEELEAALTALFGFNIPQRWSIAHLYQAILNGEEHVRHIAHITTLAGYVHHMLTGVNAVGIGEASGIIPIDVNTQSYDGAMLDKFDALIAPRGLGWKIRDILPDVLLAGDDAGKLTANGAALLGGALPAGTPFVPCEGDAETGMTASNAIKARTGNVSAGTSMFAMLVLERPLTRIYPEIDLVATPDGRYAAMVHCNNGTNDMNAWVGILREAAAREYIHPKAQRCQRGEKHRAHQVCQRKVRLRAAQHHGASLIQPGYHLSRKVIEHGDPAAVSVAVQAFRV